MPRFLPDEDELRRQIIELATNHRRWGYRKICDIINAMREKSDTYLPRVNHKRIERIWREKGLKIPQKSTKKQNNSNRRGQGLPLWFSKGMKKEQGKTPFPRQTLLAARIAPLK
ncbi:MAG: IS3 family transposase [Christensenellales bacterium]|jgi:transposase InsO family protein